MGKWSPTESKGAFQKKKKKSLQTHFILYDQRGCCEILYIKLIQRLQRQLFMMHKYPTRSPCKILGHFLSDAKQVQPQQKHNNWDNHCNQKWAETKTFRKLQISGISCHMGEMGLNKDGVCGLTGQSWRIRGREETKKANDAAAGNGRHLHILPPSVRSSPCSLGFAKGVK